MQGRLAHADDVADGVVLPLDREGGGVSDLRIRHALYLLPASRHYKPLI